MIKDSTAGLHTLNAQSIGTLQMRVYPNPSDGDFVVKFNLLKAGDATITLLNENGRLIEEKVLTNLSSGENSYQRKIRRLDRGGVYFVTIEIEGEKATQKIVIEP